MNDHQIIVASHQLSLEQQFKLKSLKVAIQDMTLEQTQDLPIDLCRQLMVKENLLADAVKQRMASEQRKDFDCDEGLLIF